MARVFQRLLDSCVKRQHPLPDPRALLWQGFKGSGGFTAHMPVWHPALRAWWWFPTERETKMVGVVGQWKEGEFRLTWRPHFRVSSANVSGSGVGLRRLLQVIQHLGSLAN